MAIHPDRADAAPLPPPRPRSLSGLCLALCLAAGLASTGYAIATGLSLTRTPPTWRSVIDGQTSKEIADALADTPLPRAAARLERGLSWLAVGDLGARVREGCPGWLFLADELTVHRDAAAHAAARAATVRRVAERLRHAGIGLLVVVVPDKSRIEARQLCAVPRPATLATRVADWTAMLSGVPVLSLADTLADPSTQYFLRTDTHWNEAGAHAAARAIAQRLRTLPQAAELSPATLRLHAEATAPVARPGDLIRLAGIDWLPASLQPPADQVRPSRFVEQPPAAGAAAAAEDDLFGDAGLPEVALLGTSFSRNGNFVPFLEAELGRRIGNFARDGAAFAGSAARYVEGESFRDNPPRLVVWEIPERVLQAPLAGEPAILADHPSTSIQP